MTSDCDKDSYVTMSLSTESAQPLMCQQAELRERERERERERARIKQHSLSACHKRLRVDAKTARAPTAMPQLQAVAGNAGGRNGRSAGLPTSHSH
jgi:hypothetical protein